MTTLPQASPRDRTRDDLYQLISSFGSMTRTDLVERTGLSRSTVAGAVARLIDEGRVVEVAPQEKGPGSGSGRPGALLRAVVSGGAVAGIDFGHAHVAVALADRFGTLLGERRAPVDVDLRADDAMDTAARLLDEMLAEHGAGQPTAVTAGIPGPLDARTGLVRSSTILSSWVGLAPARELERRLGVPVQVENDTVIGAAGEQHGGAGRLHDTFLYVKASHGIGAAMVIDGHLFRGSTGLAGEIGHTHLAGAAELCRCGSRGCLESVVSASAVLARIAHTRPTATPDQIGIDSPDEVTVRIVNEAGRTLGRVVADLCNLLNPGAIVVGGELGAVPAFVAGVESSVRRHAQPATAAATEVIAAELGTGAELAGALRLAALAASR
ncbi:ROK family transcriptional regulator [Cellulomonas sp. URHD0024]|uniref:ROK family transcriptional regulator n=1 Tax=Cellulomonas sp. URHD0024 TaxID=1302620 RepID=UPI0004249536|nr:ROK family transcriptional regulator [Cellulomonas sp. URHD0024]